MFQILPLDTNIREAYATGQDQEQNFIQNLAMFLCTFLKEHGQLVEKKRIDSHLMKVIFFSINFSDIRNFIKHIIANEN